MGAILYHADAVLSSSKRCWAGLRSAFTASARHARPPGRTAFWRLLTLPQAPAQAHAQAHRGPLPRSARRADPGGLRQDAEAALKTANCASKACRKAGRASPRAT